MPSLSDASPVDAAFFISAGAAPAQAAELASQHNAMSGRGDPGESAALRYTLAQGAGAGRAAAELKSAAPTPDSRHVSAGEAAAAAADATSARLAALHDSVMAPPASPLEYRFPSQVETPSDEALAIDSAIRSDLHANQIPKVTADAIAASVASNSYLLANETREQTTARNAATAATLAKWYGSEAQANGELVNRLLDDIGRRSPTLGRYLDAAFPMMTAIDVDQLVQLAKFRAVRR